MLDLQQLVVGRVKGLIGDGLRIIFSLGPIRCFYDVRTQLAHEPCCLGVFFSYREKVTHDAFLKAFHGSNQIGVLNTIEHSYSYSDFGRSHIEGLGSVTRRDSKFFEIR